MFEGQVTVLPKKTSDTVMVVDDLSITRAILEQVVRSIDRHIQVRAFERPVDALVWATRHVADLALVDFSMPEMDGIEFVTRLRVLPGYENVPILMVTAYDQRDVRYAALDAGISDLLTKPVDLRECVARCRNLLTLRHQHFALQDRQRLLEEMVQQSAREARARELEKETLIRLARGTDARAESRSGHVFARMPRYLRAFVAPKPMGQFRPRRKIAGRPTG
ncbi:MAG: response regulator [Betaproteobacteria bacterium]|jgi:two-component system response regulator RpfG|nr:response regulator [Betaproteobacteria bacterium]